MSGLVQDLRCAWRQLRKYPAFTASAVLTLALGIGANTAIFSLIDAVMLKALPVQNPHELVFARWVSQGELSDGVVHRHMGSLEHERSGRWSSSSFTYPVYEQIRDHSHLFSSVAALAGNGSQLNVTYDGQPGRADGQLVSGTFLSTLGIKPILGRSLEMDDDRIAANPVVVISYRYWDHRFGRNPAIVGRAITVNSVPFTIVGVSPPEFYGVQPGRAVDVWMPLHALPLVEPRWGSPLEARDLWWVLILGRLRPEVSSQQARAELEVILQRSIASDVKPSTKLEAIPHVIVVSASRGMNLLRNRFSRPLFILMVVVAIVLLIACINVANLLLARGLSRRKEIALRMTVGAGPGRLVRQLLTESVLLAGLGGVVGFILAFWGTDWLVRFTTMRQEAHGLNVAPDPRVLGFTAALSIFTGILFGLLPALRSTRLDVTPTLKLNAGDLSAPNAGERGLRLGLGRSLAIAQVALSLLLLAGAGLFLRTLKNLERVNPGFDAQNLLLFGIDPTQDGYKGQRLANFYTEMMRRFEALPSVHLVSFSHSTLISGGEDTIRTQIQPSLLNPGATNEGVATHAMWVGPKFFETLGIPLVLGRTIGEGDKEGSPKVVVVNEEFVREFLKRGNPIGGRLGFGEKSNRSDYEIVGVVGNTKYEDLRKAVPPTVYIPSLQDLRFLGPMHFEVRTLGDPGALVAGVRRAAADMDPNLALYDIRSEAAQVSQRLFEEHLFARLTSLFGTLALMLACVGIYGVTSFAVTRRTREIGIRMAIGARRVDVLGMVVREGMLLVGIGVLAGMAGALALTRFLESFLFEVKAVDPATFTAVSIFLAGVALLAGSIPAGRAAKVDPVVALRYE